MVLKRNLPFVAALAATVVAFIVVLVWLLGRVSAWNEIQRDIEDKRAALDEVEKKVPTEEHRAAIEQQHEQAEANYAALKERLLAWWDKDVYNEEKAPRQPGLFLGSLQELRSQVIKFANKQRVMLGTGVENLGFPELAQGTPPVEVTFEMLKQRSIVRDIFMLLLQNKVESIDAINWLGPDKGGALYGKHRVTVIFTCKYPSLAKLQSDLVSRAKVPVDVYGDFPRNFLVIEQLSYEAQDIKVAELEEAARQTETATGTASGTTTTRTTPSTSTRSRIQPGSLDHLRPDIREKILARERSLRGRGRYPGETYPGETIRRPGAATSGRTATRTTREEPRPTVGREPNYNILTVTMTITMADFTEQITGKIPTLEEDKKKPTTTRERPTTAANSPQ